MRAPRLLIVLNRYAGRCNDVQIAREARRALWGYQIDVVAPKDREELGRILRATDPKIYHAILLGGGDGTVNASLPFLIHHKVPLLPLPLGTANDLAANLGIALDWRELQSLLDHGETASIDLIRVNEALYATIGGMGVGAILTHDINEFRERSFSFQTLCKVVRSDIYTLMTARTIVFRRGFTHRLRISIPDHPTQEIESGVILACNQSFLGGNLKVSSQSVNDDGKMEIFVGNVRSRLDLMAMLVDIKRGRSSSLADIFSTQKLTIEDLDGRPIMIFGDGETLCSSPRVEFSVAPKALLVLRQAQRSSSER